MYLSVSKGEFILLFSVFKPGVMFTVISDGSYKQKKSGNLLIFFRVSDRCKMKCLIIFNAKSCDEGTTDELQMSLINAKKGDLASSKVEDMFACQEGMTP